VFLVTDLTNRALGPQAARRVAWVGFAIAVLVSLALAPWRIALASGAAFLFAQLMDITVFNRFRAQSWWKAPLIGSLVASVVDTAVFFFLAFAGTADSWLMLASGDLAVKALMAAVLLAPYRALLPRLQTWGPPPSAAPSA
jgi:queuosine precursor transporter